MERAEDVSRVGRRHHRDRGAGADADPGSRNAGPQPVRGCASLGLDRGDRLSGRGPPSRSEQPPMTQEAARAARPVDAGRADPGHCAGLPDRPDHRPVRDRCDRRAAAGRAHHQRPGGRGGGPQERSLHHPGSRGGHRRGQLGHGRHLHPARRRRADRRLEHGRHHPDRRLLRRRAAERAVVLPGHGHHLRPGGPGHRQLVDHRRHARRRLRGAGAAGRRRSGDRRRRGHLRRLLRRQDDPHLRDDGAGAVDGRQRDDPGAHRRDAVDLRAGRGDRPGRVRADRAAGAAVGIGLRSVHRPGCAGLRVLDLAAQPPAAGVPDHPLAPPRAALPGDLRQRAVRRGDGRLHAARGGRGVRG